MRGKARQYRTGQKVILAKQPDNLPVVRKTTGFMLGIHLVAVRADSEHTAGTGNEFNLGTEFLFQFDLQTGGSGLVVSCRAVFNGDLHGFFSLFIVGASPCACPKMKKGNHRGLPLQHLQNLAHLLNPFFQSTGDVRQERQRSSIR